MWGWFSLSVLEVDGLSGLCDDDDDEEDGEADDVDADADGEGEEEEEGADPSSATGKKHLPTFCGPSSQISVFNLFSSSSSIVTSLFMTPFTSLLPIALPIPPL